MTCLAAMTMLCLSSGCASCAPTVSPATADSGLYPATIVVMVDPAAVVEFDGEKTKSVGGAREFETPPLNPARQYTYTIAAYRAGTGNGVPYVSRAVTVKGGDVVNVDLRSEKVSTSPKPKARAKTSKTDCPSSCDCGKCGDGCKCQSGSPCGGNGCSCVLQGGSSEPNFGVDKGKLRDNGDGIWLNGKRISRRQARDLFEADPRLRDDSKYLRVTVIGPAAARAKVDQDWATSPALAPYRDRYVYQSYEPNHPLIQRYGFVTTGQPTIYIQRPDGFGPDGKEPWRSDTYGGADALAGALRQADQAYDPKNDKDPTKPVLGGGSLIDALKGVPTPVWLLGGGGVVFLILNNQKPEEKKGK